MLIQRMIMSSTPMCEVVRFNVGREVKQLPKGVFQQDE